MPRGIYPRKKKKYPYFKTCERCKKRRFKVKEWRGSKRKYCKICRRILQGKSREISQKMKQRMKKLWETTYLKPTEIAKKLSVDCHTFTKYLRRHKWKRECKNWKDEHKKNFKILFKGIITKSCIHYIPIAMRGKKRNKFCSLMCFRHYYERNFRRTRHKTIEKRVLCGICGRTGTKVALWKEKKLPNGTWKKVSKETYWIQHSVMCKTTK